MRRGILVVDYAKKRRAGEVKYMAIELRKAYDDDLKLLGWYSVTTMTSQALKDLISPATASMLGTAEGSKTEQLQVRSGLDSGASSQSCSVRMATYVSDRRQVWTLSARSAHG